MTEDVGTRWIAFIGTTSIHLALGLALMSAASEIPMSGRADNHLGKPATFNLLPFERTSDSPGKVRTISRDARSAETVSRPADRLSDDPSLATVTAPSAPTPIGHDSVETAATAARPAADLPNAEVLAYRARLQAHLDRFRVYPIAARTAGQHGVVTLRLEMNRTGHVVNLWVESSSGASLIDDEAVAAVARAQPLPPFPAGWPEQMSIAIPVSFRLD